MAGFAIASLTLVGLATAAAAAPAATYTWSGGGGSGNTNWSDGANWQGGVAPTAGSPVDLVFPAPSGSGSVNDITGLTVASFSTTGQSTSGDAITLTGPLTIGGSVSVLALNLAEAATPTWALTSQNVTFSTVTGGPVIVTLAGGSQMAGNFETSGLAVEGANPAAAPASNGSIDSDLGPVGAYFADIAINWAASNDSNAQTGPFGTNGDAISLSTSPGSPFGGFGPQTDIILGGPVAFDPASTITYHATPISPPLEFQSYIPAIDTSAGVALNGVNLAITPCGATGTLVSAGGGVTGTFDQVIGGKEVPIPNHGLLAVGGCYEQINYTSTSVTATSVSPSMSLSSSHSPSLPNEAETFTATVNPVPDGGTVSFTNNGTPITGCTAVPVSTSTGQATCPTSFSTIGTYQIVANYSGTVDTLAKSASFSQVVVPAPTAAITSSSGLFAEPEVLQGTASDVGGPGVAAVILYWHDYTGTNNGATVASCTNCGSGQTTVLWLVTIPAGSPPGVYSFVAQAVDSAGNFGPASNVIYQIIT